MIISGFITICTSIIQFLFSWVNLPDIPLSAQSTFDTYMSYMQLKKPIYVKISLKSVGRWGVAFKTVLRSNIFLYKS